MPRPPRASPPLPGGPLFHTVARGASAVLRWILTRYFHIVTAGMEQIPRRGPAIIAGNHPSLLDGLLLYLLTPHPLRFVAHRELFRHPFIGPVMRGLGFIDAGERRRALHQAEAALRQGEVLVLFPEGDAYACGRMERMHPGVAVLALRTAASIVPLAIAGAAEAHPMGTYLPRPQTIALVLGPPVRYANAPAITGERVDEGALVGMLIDLRRRILALGRRAQHLRRRAHPHVRRGFLQILTSGLLLLPLVALLNVTAHGLKTPEHERERGCASSPGRIR